MRALSQIMLLLVGCTTATQAASIKEALEKRQTTHTLFKGNPIPKVNWTSPNTYNFTWGLTGVDNYENSEFGESLVATLVAIFLFLFLYRILTSHLHHIRLVASVTSTTSAKYFAQPLSKTLQFVQKHLLLAPLFRRRHNEPLQTRWFQLYLGTLPSRINGILLFVYISSNILYCTLYLPWNGKIGPDHKLHAPTKADLVAEFRGRTGVLAMVNMIPLFVCMMRNNYLGKAAGVSFNTWNLYHRWTGRFVVLESFAHMGAWTVNKVDQADWSGVGEALRGSRFFQMGLMAEVALFLILVSSIAPFRHAHYQIFLATHQICIFFFLAGAWLHCHIDELPHETFANVAIFIWIFERLHRVFTLYRKNFRFGKGLSVNTADIKVVPAGDDAVHVSITMKKGWDYKPGQHAYLYIPRLSWTQSHPFSIAWSTTSSSDEAQTPPVSTIDTGNNKGAPSKPELDNSITTLAHRNLVTSKPTTTIHFIISKRRGFTNRLFIEAAKAGNSTDPEKVDTGPRSLLALVEGPYHNEVHSFDSFASVLFVAGGSGITHPLGYIRHLLAASTDNLVATRRIKLVWVVRDRGNVSWVSQWLEELWRLDAGRGILGIEIYVTRPSSHCEVDMSGRVRWFVGRPQMEVVLAGMLAPRRMRGGRGALAVNVCGPGSLADGVRAAVREKVDEGRIEFSEESFTWS